MSKHMTQVIYLNCQESNTYQANSLFMSVQDFQSGLKDLSGGYLTVVCQPFSPLCKKTPHLANAKRGEFNYVVLKAGCLVP